MFQSSGFFLRLARHCFSGLRNNASEWFFSLNLQKKLVFSRLEHRSSPTCICIQPTIHILCIFVLVILCFLSSRKQELTNLYFYSTHYSAIPYFILTIWLWMTKNYQQPVWYPQRNEEKAKVFETQLLYNCCDWERGECFWNAQFWCYLQ